MLFGPLLLVTLNVNYIPHLSGLSCCGLMGAAGWGCFRSRRVPWSDGAPAVFGSPPWTVGSAGAPVQQQSLQTWILDNVAGLCCKLALTTSCLVNDCTDAFMPSLNQLSRSLLWMRSLSGHSLWEISLRNEIWMLNLPWRCPNLLTKAADPTCPYSCCDCDD